MTPLSWSTCKFTLQSCPTRPQLVFYHWEDDSISPPHPLKLLPPPAHTMTTTFPHSRLAEFPEHPSKTFVSVWLRNSTWSTKFPTTFTYPTSRNMTIFHLMLVTAFWTGKNKHPQNVSMIFYSKSLLLD